MSATHATNARQASSNASRIRRSNRPKVDLLMEDHPELADQILAIASNLDLGLKKAGEAITEIIPGSIGTSAIATWRSKHGVGTGRAAQHSRTERRAAERDAESTSGDFEYDLASGTGHITVTTQGEGVVGDLDELLAFHGLDPEKVQVVGTATVSRWTTSRWDKETGEVEVIWNTSHRFRIEAIRDDSFDLPEVLALAEASVTAYVGAPAENDITGFLVISDMQVGKVDRRGGTQELFDRAAYVRQWVEQYAGARNLNAFGILEPGDIIEGTESAGGLNTLIQNDLKSPMTQVAAATSLAWKFTETALRIAPSVLYGSVPSNHAAFRRGALAMGGTEDDWGIAIARQMGVYAELKGEAHRLTIAVPDEFDESLRIELGHDTAIGMTHGHKLRGGIDKWYAAQCANAMAPVAGVNVLVTGHLHNPVERNIGLARNGYPTFWNQAPSLDGGSSWYEQVNGAAISAPAAMYFEASAKHGYDPQSRRLITAPWEQRIAQSSRSTTVFGAIA